MFALVGASGSRLESSSLVLTAGVRFGQNPPYPDIAVGGQSFGDSIGSVSPGSWNNFLITSLMDIIKYSSNYGVWAPPVVSRQVQFTLQSGPYSLVQPSISGVILFGTTFLSSDAVFSPLVNGGQWIWTAPVNDGSIPYYCRTGTVQILG